MLCIKLSKVLLSLSAAHSDFEITHDEDNNQCIRFKPPSNIKQNQGGLKRSRGAQLLDINPYIYIYPDQFDPFLDGLDILSADAAYRRAAFGSSTGNKEECPRFFLQLKHTNTKVCALQCCSKLCKAYACWLLFESSQTAILHHAGTIPLLLCCTASQPCSASGHLLTLPPLCVLCVWCTSGQREQRWLRPRQVP